MLRRICLCIGLGAAMGFGLGCETHTTMRTVRIHTNRPGTVMTAKAGQGPDSVMIKTNPSGTKIKIKDHK